MGLLYIFAASVVVIVIPALVMVHRANQRMTKITDDCSKKCRQKMQDQESRVRESLSSEAGVSSFLLQPKVKPNAIHPK